MDSIETQYTRIFNVFTIINNVLLGIVIACIGWKIYENLFKFNHNWIIKPSTQNKYYAIFAPIFKCAHLWISASITCIHLAYPDTYKLLMILTIINSIIGAIGSLCHYLYFVSTLAYQMEKEPLIKNMISNKSIIFIKVLCCKLHIDGYVIMVLYAEKHSISNTIYIIACIDGVIDWMLDLTIQSVLLRLYISGLNNICHWWYSKRWDEYEKYGDTPKIHEILIVITRTTVIVSITLLMHFIFILIEFCIAIYFMSPYFDALGMFVLNIIHSILTNINYIFAALSIYFIYDFGYDDYRVCCSICHVKMYMKCYERHKNEIINGTFDGDKYRSNINRCCWNKFKQTHIELIEFD
eukprot:463362_1